MSVFVVYIQYMCMYIMHKYVHAGWLGIKLSECCLLGLVQDIQRIGVEEEMYACMCISLPDDLFCREQARVCHPHS